MLNPHLQKHTVKREYTQMEDPMQSKCLDFPKFHSKWFHLFRWWIRSSDSEVQNVCIIKMLQRRKKLGTS